jgi:hypothetical protein
MAKKRIAKQKKAQTISTIIKLVIGLVVVGMLIYLGYRYILGTGESVGQLGTCTGQGGDCVTREEACEGRRMFGVGCPENEEDEKQDKNYCCLPERTS